MRTTLAWIVAAAAVLALAATPCRAEDNREKLKQDVKELGKSIGEAGKDVGKTIGDAGKRLGGDVADAAKEAWPALRKASLPLLEDVKRATKDFWERVLGGKDRTIEALKRENEELRAKLAQKKDGR